MSALEMHAKPGRLVFVIAFIAVWGLIIPCRLVQLQVFRHQEYLQLALKQHEVTRLILPPRGTIYDSHRDELVASVTVSTVVAEPRKLQDARAAAQNLAPVLQIDSQELLGRMKDPERERFLVVKRRIDPGIEPKIAALGINGIYLVDESMRVYPNRALAGNTLGFVNMDGDAAAGLELEYDSELKGSAGQISFMGSMSLGNHVFHDHKPYGLLTFREILEYSSNIGAAKLGMRLGQQRLYEAVRTFGFGSRTRVDLPAEIAGRVRDWRDWSALSIAAISFGQEVGVTSMQILVAICNRKPGSKSDVIWTK